MPDYAADYYAERAANRGGAGLLISEGTQPCFAGQGYVRTPGIHTSEQIIAWRKVTAAVHAEGSKIFLQIMHVGRISSHYNRTGDAPAVAPSAILAEGVIHTDAAGMQPHDMPQALTLSEIQTVIDEHEIAARNAILAGFDGVELHAMGPYLAVQFLSTSANHRDDAYGGTVERRIRFVAEVLAAMAKGAGGADKVGIRISPGFTFFGIDDENPELLYNRLVETIAPLGLAYLHVLEMQRLEPPPGMEMAATVHDYIPALRQRFPGTLIVAGNYTAQDAADAIASGRADLVAFGRPFINNPDLAKAFAEERSLIEADPALFYSEGPKGYTEI